MKKNQYCTFFWRLCLWLSFGTTSSVSDPSDFRSKPVVLIY